MLEIFLLGCAVGLNPFVTLTIVLMGAASNKGLLGPEAFGMPDPAIIIVVAAMVGVDILLDKWPRTAKTWGIVSVGGRGVIAVVLGLEYATYTGLPEVLAAAAMVGLAVSVWGLRIYAVKVTKAKLAGLERVAIGGYADFSASIINFVALVSVIAAALLSALVLAIGAVLVRGWTKE